MRVAACHILLALLLLGGAAAGHGQSAVPPAAARPAPAAEVPVRPPGTVVLTGLNRPDTLNPLLARDTVAMELGDLLFSGLVQLNERGEPVPDLAESWRVSEDGRAWVFNLRRGVRFHDGQELTSRDVLYTYQALLDPALDTIVAPLQQVVEGLEAPGRHLFRITLREPYGPLPFLLRREILPAHLLEEGRLSAEEFGRRPVGSGPFRFAGWSGNEVVLAAYEDYHGGRPRVDRVIFRSYPDRLAAWSALMRGEADVVPDLDLADYRVLAGDPRFRVYEVPHGFYYTLLFNLREPLFLDPELRRALSLAVDRRDLIERALGGWGLPADGPFRPGTWPHDDTVQSDPCRPEEARALLESLGWRDADGDRIREREGRELAFTLLVDRGDSIKEAAARRLRWQLYQVGVRVEVAVKDVKELLEGHLLPGTFQAALLQFNSQHDPDMYAFRFWHSANIGRTNLAAYHNPRVDTLFIQGRTAAGLEERRAIYHELHRLIAADRPALFLFFRTRFAGFSARVRGVRIADEVFYHSVREWSIVETPDERR